MGISVAALVSGCSVSSAADTLFIGCILDNAFVTMFHCADASIFTGMTGNKVHESESTKTNHKRLPSEKVYMKIPIKK